MGDVHYALLLQSLLVHNSTEPLRFLDFSAPVLDANNQTIGVIAAHLKYSFPLLLNDTNCYHSWVWARSIEDTIVSLSHVADRQVEFFIVTNV